MCRAGEPEAAAQTLIAMANAAGGKDNVTVVYVEGERFAMSQRRRAVLPRNDRPEAVTAPPQKRPLRSALFAIALLAVGFAIGRSDLWLPYLVSGGPRPAAATEDVQVVQSTESIAAAVARAAPGSQVIVEPGEYRERVFLKEGIRLTSRVPRGATIRLPSTAADTDLNPAVIATGLTRAELSGFKIVGDAATPLGVAIGIIGGALSVI